MTKSVRGMFLKVFALAALLPVGMAAAQMGDGQSPAMAMGNGRGVQGTVTATAADHLTLKTEKGEIYQVAISPNTRVMKGREQVKIADVHAGDGIGAMGEIDQPNKTVHALFLMVVDAEQLKKAREAMGKTFISGTVTAIDETKLTILRTDQVSQVIVVDEDTSFRRGGRGMQMMAGGAGAGAIPAAPRAGAADGGESVTLADVKVGSVVIGQGALKNGVFVPTTLGISEPGAQRQRRRPDGAGAPATSTGTTPPAATEPK